MFKGIDFARLKIIKKETVIYTVFLVIDLNHWHCSHEKLNHYLLVWSLEPNFSSVQFSRSVVSDSLWRHGLKHARLPCPSPTPRVYSNSCPLSWWCHPTISSSVIPFSSRLQSFPVSRSFQMMNLIYLLAVLLLDYSYDTSVFWQFLALIPLPPFYLQLFLCARKLASIPDRRVGMFYKNVFLQLTFS